MQKMDRNINADYRSVTQAFVLPGDGIYTVTRKPSFQYSALD